MRLTGAVGLRLTGTVVVVAESGYADIARDSNAIHFDETGKCVEIGKWVFHLRLSRDDVDHHAGSYGASDRCKGHRHILLVEKGNEQKKKTKE